jgi:ribosomal protein S18 acetylase RimI-like enzyme
MIRAAVLNDAAQLKCLYEGSIYRSLPAHVRWALDWVPNRVLVVRRRYEIVATTYTMECGYGNFWASYLAFKDEKEATHLVDYLMNMRDKRGLRNLYLFCPKEFVGVRVHLITRGFIPEDTRKISGLDYIIESHNRAFNPDYKSPQSKEKAHVQLRKGKVDDSQTVAKILHDSLPRDFVTLKDANKCAKRWLAEMPENTVVAESNNLPVGIVLLSQEVNPVLDKKLAMLCYMAVEQSLRGRGIGEALIRTACNTLRNKGKHGMEVDVSVGNMPARIFYTKVGFYPFWYSRDYMRHDDGIFYMIDF